MLRKKSLQPSALRIFVLLFMLFLTFLSNVEAGTTEMVSVSSSGVQGNTSSFSPSISANGRFVAFSSDARNLVLGGG